MNGESNVHTGRSLLLFDRGATEEDFGRVLQTLFNGQVPAGQYYSKLFRIGVVPKAPDEIRYRDISPFGVVGIERERQLKSPALQPGQPEEEPVQAYSPLQQLGVLDSPYHGSGIKVAVLDTGFRYDHPDFVGRDVIRVDSFVPEFPADDTVGHGTHCIGLACGPRGTASDPGRESSPPRIL